MQTPIVILLVAGCALWLTYQVYRYFKPKAGGKRCAGGCCDGDPKKPAAQASPAARPLMMISSDDLRHRLQARKNAS